MRILVCPTAFKGTLTADEASRAMARGARSALPDAEIVRQPLSDGGPGLLDALRSAGTSTGFELEEATVRGPLGRPVLGRILWTAAPPAGVATIESADACGLDLVPPERRDPLRGSTVGVGDLIRRAAERGAATIRVGLGGSGTVDGGTGAARAFGWRFLDAGEHELPPGGGGLERLARIEAGPRPEARLLALCDVDHPLVGPRGAARTFAPQKGAGPDEVRRLEVGLERLAARLGAQFGLEVGQLPGGGAAGGLGAGLAAFLGAELVPGADRVLEAIGFELLLEGTDAVVTGEGAFDRTSLEGKIVGKVCRTAHNRGVPVVLVCGRVDQEPPEGVRAVDAGGARLDAPGLAKLTSGVLATVAEA